MTRYKLKGGERVALTDAELAEVEAKEAAWNADAPKRAALDEIKRLERLETPRRIAEAALSEEGKAWLQANRDLIAIERTKL